MLTAVSLVWNFVLAQKSNHIDTVLRSRALHAQDIMSWKYYDCVEGIILYKHNFVLYKELLLDS